MKFLLILTIKIYWRIIPKSKRRPCLFRISCSKHVYETTVKSGCIAGIKALMYRMENCRKGYHMIENHTVKEIRMILPNGDVLEQNEISKRFLNK